MLSKLILRKALLQDSTEKISLVSTRLFKNVPPASFKPTTASIAGGDPEIEKHLANWEFADSLFYSPQRDHKNYPTLKMTEQCPPVKLGFLPASWFDQLYEKTGVTGPYLFGVGLVTFLMSKEIVIVEHQFAHFLSFWSAVILLRWKFGKQTAAWFTERTTHSNKTFGDKPIEDAIQSSEKSIEQMNKIIKYDGGQKYLWQSKKENVDLQLESVYRQRLAEVHLAVKKRLDYHVEVENVKKRAEQSNLVDWISRNVVMGITPQQEKESIVKCISDLKSLGTKHNLAA